MDDLHSEPTLTVAEEGEFLTVGARVVGGEGEALALVSVEGGQLHGEEARVLPLPAFGFGVVAGGIEKGSRAMRQLAHPHGYGEGLAILLRQATDAGKVECPDAALAETLDAYVPAALGARFQVNADQDLKLRRVLEAEIGPPQSQTRFGTICTLERERPCISGSKGRPFGEVEQPERHGSRGIQAVDAGGGIGQFAERAVLRIESHPHAFALEHGGAIRQCRDRKEEHGKRAQEQAAGRSLASGSCPVHGGDDSPRPVALHNRRLRRVRRRVLQSEGHRAHSCREPIVPIGV